nr:tetratricopeptide repeat protein [Rhodothermaceae bacterium]
GSFEKALEAAKKALSIQDNVLSPNHPFKASTYNSLSIIYHNMGAYEAAIQAQQKALAIQEKNFEANNAHIGTSHYNIAVSLLKLERYEQALESALKAQESLNAQNNQDHPNYALLHNTLSLIHLNLGNFQQALDAAQTFTKIQEQRLEPNHPELAIAYVNLSEIYLNLGNNEMTLTERQKALVIQENDSTTTAFDLLNSYIHIYRFSEEKGDHRTAVDMLQKSIALAEGPYKTEDPATIPNMYLFLAQSLIELEQYEDAKGHLLRAASMYGELGDKYAEYKSAAITLFTDTVLAASGQNADEDQYPTSVETYYEAAFDFFQQGQYRQSIEQFNLLLEVQPDHADAHVLLGRCYYELGEYQDAIRFYEQGYQLAPENKQLYHNNIGFAYAKLKDFENAKTHFEQLSQLNPTNPFTPRAWAVYYALQNNTKEALSYLEKAIELGYDDINWIKTEESLNSIREEIRYKDIVNQIEDTVGIN